MTEDRRTVAELPELNETPANADVVHVVDVSDTSEDPGGTSKKVTKQNLVGGLATQDSVTSVASDLDALEADFAEEHNPDGSHGVVNADSLTLPTGVTVTAILDEDNMTTDSNTAVPTQQSVKAYVDNEISSLPSASTKGELFLNTVINGGFDVWQRGTTFTTPNDDLFGPDRWNLLVETNGAWTFSRSTDVPVGVSKYSLKAENVTLNNQCAIVQLIEGVDVKKIAGKTVSLSFYAKTANTEISNLRATVLAWTSTEDVMTSDVIGTWAQGGTDPTWATNYTQEIAGTNHSLTNSWQRFTLPNIALDTVGITNLAIVIWVDDGTVAAGDEFYITGIQLNEGTSAVDYQPKSFESELLACKRFYQRWTSVGAGGSFARFQVGHCKTSTAVTTIFQMPVRMRVEPSLTSSGSFGVLKNDDTIQAVTSISKQTTGSSNEVVQIDFGVASGLVGGECSEVFANNNNTAYLELSSEL